MRLDGRGVLPGWELEEEESKSERTLALGPAVCLGHGFLIIKLSLKGERGAQGRFLWSYGRVLSPTEEPEQSIYEVAFLRAEAPWDAHGDPRMQPLTPFLEVRVKWKEYCSSLTVTLRGSGMACDFAHGRL